VHVGFGAKINCATRIVHVEIGAKINCVTRIVHVEIKKVRPLTYLRIIDEILFVNQQIHI
jgi:hypothetical protein